ncbi:hypothetical protein P154DRAFT_425830 [Amniculicola lignicola CBS 123094]|uniref:GPI anchored serine-threonine rich protein n=1 Tax=Amniculicola lignicola CBS 123094 TaxID=1392246 RepID=A0A6A5WUP9_9PLEO|nr:hypothetical protein P154DRAFT_425830 [Amniculicola lignicola CBS 123094]
MRFAAVFAIASALGFAAAQSATPTPVPTPVPTPNNNNKCQAQNIVDACLEGIQKQVDACPANDWICLCDNYSSLLTCYNNCPNSVLRPSVQQQVDSYCQAAAPSASLASVASVLKTAGTYVPTTASATAAQTGDSSSTASVSAGDFTSTPTGAAGSFAVPATGIMAVLLGLAGLL